MDKLRFAQSVSRLRTLETKILDKGKIDRLIDSSSPEEALKLLQETQYGSNMASIKKPQDYEMLLSDELKRLYLLMYEVCPEKSVIDIMSIRYDYHNIKVMLKSRAISQDLSHLLIPVGTISIEKMKKYFKEEDFRDLKGFIKEAVFRGEQSLRESKDPQRIDVILDEYMYKDMLSKAQETGEKFLIDFIRINVDLINIKTLLRVKKQNKNRDFLSSVLIHGGKVDTDALLNIYNDNVENIVGKLSYTDYYNVLKEGIEDYLKTGRLNNLEKLSDNFLMEYIKNSKFVSFGVEPIIAYIYAKENEIKLLRIIMVGKLNSVSSDVIRERLRDNYV